MELEELARADGLRGLSRAPRRLAWLRLRIVVAVAAGGAIGAPLREEMSRLVTGPAGGFPLSTWLINVSGSFVLGLLLTLIVERWPPTEYARPFVATGIIGAYTTWSTFMVDTDVLVKDGHPALAGVYVLASLAGGLAAVYAGVGLVRRWPGRARNHTRQTLNRRTG